MFGQLITIKQSQCFPRSFVFPHSMSKLTPNEAAMKCSIAQDCELILTGDHSLAPKRSPEGYDAISNDNASLLRYGHCLAICTGNNS